MGTYLLPFRIHLALYLAVRDAEAELIEVARRARILASADSTSSERIGGAAFNDAWFLNL